MIAGPVFHFELIRTARQRRFYIVRFVFGLVLLGLIGVNYAGIASRRWFMDQAYSGMLSTREMNAFGYTIFGSMMYAQVVLVLGLTPALVADSVASERQRKTLHYLMTSRLTGVEIVLGKLGARLLNMGTYLAASLPIVSLLTLFGGVDPVIVVLSYATLGSTTFFLAALAILASVTSRRSRDAVAAAYALGATWMVGPPLVGAVVSGVYALVVDLWGRYQTGNGDIWPHTLVLALLAVFAVIGLAIFASVFPRRSRNASGVTYALLTLWLIGLPLFTTVFNLLPPPFATAAPWVQWVNDWLVPDSPLALLTRSRMAFLGGSGAVVWEQAAWMFGSQIGFGSLLVALAAWQVRPAFRRLESRSEGGRAARGPARRWTARRPCGDDPIYWKEAYFTRSGGGITKRLSRMILPLLMASIVLGIVYFSAWDAFGELWAHGYGAGDYPTSQHRWALNSALRMGGTAIFALWMLQLAAMTAASFTSEREQDTWLSLLATPLEGAEILRGKMFAALRTTIHYPVTILALWLLGLAAGAVHPLGFVTAVAAGAMFTWFVTALGTYVSLKSKTTWRAQVWTQGVIIAPHLCCLYFAPSILITMGLVLFSYADVDGFFKMRWELDMTQWWTLLGIAYVTGYVGGGLAFYLGGAYAMTRAAFVGFDATVDRPRQQRRRVPTKFADPKKVFEVGGPGDVG